MESLFSSKPGKPRDQNPLVRCRYRSRNCSTGSVRLFIVSSKSNRVRTGQREAHADLRLPSARRTANIYSLRVTRPEQPGCHAPVFPLAVQRNSLRRNRRKPDPRSAKLSSALGLGSAQTFGAEFSMDNILRARALAHHLNRRTFSPSSFPGGSSSSCIPTCSKG